MATTRVRLPSQRGAPCLSIHPQIWFTVTVEHDRQEDRGEDAWHLVNSGGDDNRAGQAQDDDQPPRQPYSDDVAGSPATLSA